MYDNFRLFFSIVWLLATGAMVAIGFMTIVSWGDYLQEFIYVVLLWSFATIATIVTSR